MAAQAGLADLISSLAAAQLEQAFPARLCDRMWSLGQQDVLNAIERYLNFERLTLVCYEG